MLVVAVAVWGAPIAAIAQELREVKTPDKPLVLKAQGSFFVGGEKAASVPGATSRSIRCTCAIWFRKTVTATYPW